MMEDTQDIQEYARAGVSNAILDGLSLYRHSLPWIIQRSVQRIAGEKSQPVTQAPQLASGETVDGALYRLVGWSQYLRNYPWNISQDEQFVQQLQASVDAVAITVQAIRYHLIDPESIVQLNFPAQFDRIIPKDVFVWIRQNADQSCLSDYDAGPLGKKSR